MVVYDASDAKRLSMTKERFKALQRAWSRFDRSTALFAKERFNPIVCQENWEFYLKLLDSPEIDS